MSSLPTAVRAGIALLAFAALAALTLVNFDLVYRGMLAMVPYGKTRIAAGIITWVELSMGAFLLESRGASRMFSVISQLPR